MKRTIVFLLLLTCGALAAASAQAPAPKPAGNDLRIAVVQFQVAVGATNEFQRDFAGVQKKFDPKRTELKNLGDEIDKLTKQLQTDGPKLSQTEQASRERTIETKKKQAQRLADDDQTEYTQAVQEVFNRVASKVGELLASYAKDHGYSLIIDRTEQEQAPSMVLWSDPSMDITQQIVESYNTKSGVPAQSATAPPEAPKPSAPK